MSEKNYDDETLDAICDGLDYCGHQTGAEAIRQLRAANARLVAAGDAIQRYAHHHDTCGDMDGYNGVSPPRCDCGMDEVTAAWRAAKEQQT
jgi:hypothetical protein